MPRKRRPAHPPIEHSEPIQFARNQRQHANEFSQMVWQMVRNSQIRNQKFRREHPIPPYTVDFFCMALKVIVEIDGKDHLTNEGKQHDQTRDEFLRGLGYEILRIPGYQVTQDPDAVRTMIENFVDERLDQS